MNDYVINPFRQASPAGGHSLVGACADNDPLTFHRTLPGYTPTPLVSLPGLARELGVGEILVKDESHRLGLNAFKVLGASWAVYRYLKARWESETGQPFGDTLTLTPAQRAHFGDLTLSTATDGNHGRGVAWTARTLGLRAVIYMPRGTVPARVLNIRRENATVEVIDGTYDDAVEKIKADSARNGWQIVSDTSWPGYDQIPGWIQAAYTSMFREMETVIHAPDDPMVDLVFLQGGVGALAAGAIWYYVGRYGARRPNLVCLEPTDAACLLESARTPDGSPAVSRGKLTSIMAGLNCGVPSAIAWPIVRDATDLFVAMEDSYAWEAMRRYYHPAVDNNGTADPRITSGESGAAGLAALLALLQADDLAPAREFLGLSPASRILLLNTEGATDPEGFARTIQSTGERPR